jgi:asparagine synthase (glutamine-hydrolysing)
MVVDATPAPSTMLAAARSVGAVARAQGVDVVLVGDGGDQVLDGDPRLFGELARRGHLLRGVKGALRIRGGDAFYQSRVKRLGGSMLKPLLGQLLPPAAFRRVSRIWRRLPAWAGPAVVRNAEALQEPIKVWAATEASPDERYRQLLGWPTFSRWSVMRLQKEAVGGYVLRAPFFDDDFLRFVATIPPLSLMEGGFFRGLMREGMRGLVPEALRLRETKGSSYFFTKETLTRAGGLGTFAGVADVRMLADLGLVAPKAFKSLLESYERAPGAGATYADLWRILSVEAFLRQQGGDEA